MSDKSAIEWTDATWNPTTGCSKVSPGCAHCYAERLSLRFGTSTKPWTPANAEQNVTIHPARFDMPLKWREPKRIFVDSMSDLFHELVPDWVVARVWDMMAKAPRHQFQILTKRPERMPEIVTRRVEEHGVLPNVWLGTSIENNRWVGRANLPPGFRPDSCGECIQRVRRWKRRQRMAGRSQLAATTVQ